MLVGLGNPGKEYAKTRHNIGFIFLDYLAEKFNFTFKQSRWQADFSKETLWDRQVILLKPLTFMNRSGQAVGEACRYHQIEPSEVLVIHDDLDLELGKIRLVTNRGTGGHNGIRSIVEHLGTKDFMRLRVGIGRPQVKEEVSNYVLNRFASEEQALVQQALENIEAAVQLVFAKGTLAAMTTVNR